MDCKDDRVFKNILGTWMVSIQMMICYSDATNDDML